MPLVAIGPQIPESLINVKKRHSFAFHVASDTGAHLGRRFGLTFKSEGTPKPESIAQGLEELPHPAVIVVDSNHVVRFVDVTPNWMARSEAGPVLDAVRKLSEGRAQPVASQSAHA